VQAQLKGRDDAQAEENGYSPSTEADRQDRSPLSGPPGREPPEGRQDEEECCYYFSPARRTRGGRAAFR
jgi:hypothetical protein